MIWNRRLAVGVLVAGIGTGMGWVRAEDSAPKKDEPAAAPKEAPKKKEPFFGDHFAMYLETRGGPSNVDTISNPVSSGAQSHSASEIEFNGNKSGQFTIGWTLPRGRGQYLFTYNGIADGDYELKATGYQQSYIQTGGGASKVVNDLLPWWQLDVKNGQLHTTQTPPVWDSELDDADGDQFPDRNEIRFPATVIDLSTTVPQDLGNRVQTWDLYYRREFGGVKIRSRWTAGARYLKYDGAIPSAAWLTGAVGTPGFGYSDGLQNKMLLMQQETSGWGPVGSGEIQFNFFRQRLTLYALVQAAFLLETLKTDSGTFTFLAIDTSTGSPRVLPGAGNINQEVSKSTWNTAFEAGVRVKMLQGFNFILDWNTTGYLDTVLLPKQLSIPTNSSQVGFGAEALFISRDIVVSTIHVGLSYQF